MIFMAVGRCGYVGLVRVEDDQLNVAAAMNSCTDFTPISLGSRTLPLDSGSALVEAR